MQLPGALFEEIIGALNAPAAASGVASVAPAAGAEWPVVDEPGGAHRRREPRLAVQARVTLIPLTEQDSLAAGPLTAPLRDLSAGGIGFLHSGKITLDEQFVVLLPHGQRGDSVAVLCQVANYQPLAERVYAVGARFLRVLRQPAAAGAEAGTLSFPSRQAAGLRRVAS